MSICLVGMVDMVGVVCIEMNIMISINVMMNVTVKIAFNRGVVVVVTKS